MDKNNKRILGVGIATVDLINEVDQFPAEDSEHRALTQRICRGGNATNTLVVLQQLGHQCAWAGTLADDANAKIILSDLTTYHVDLTHIKHIHNTITPTSYVTLNRRTGSRTIVHYRDLAEYGFVDFQKINLDQFQWIHFEGRNISETKKMLRYAQQHYGEITRSLEVEKIRTGMEQLFPLVHIILFSKDYASHLGATNANQFLTWMRKKIPNADLICTWGEQGGFALPKNSPLLHAPALPIKRTIDTLGAGDTFNAAMIHQRLAKENWQTALNAACQLAGKKCSQYGFSNIP